ncbi:MAG: GTP cyclohydrolase II RibA [Patescibacteria group bacterium]
MLTSKQLAKITRLQKTKQKQSRTIPNKGIMINYCEKKFIVYRTVFVPYEDSILLVKKYMIKPGERVLDIGTGCGVIAVFSAYKGASKVVAVDTNSVAVRATNQNAHTHGFTKIIDARCSDLFNKLETGEKFDVITVNLPYRNKAAKDLVEASFWDSGFRTYKRFFSEVSKYLNRNGRIYLAQANYGDIAMMKRLAKAASFTVKLIGKKTMPKGDPRVFYVFEIKRSAQKIKVAGPIKMPALVGKQSVAHFKLYLLRLRNGDYYALEKGRVKGTDWPLVRIHSACNTAQIFHSQRCDCHAQLQMAMEVIHRARKGLIIYVVNHEGRGVGAFNHIRVYQKQDEGYDTIHSYLTLGLPVDSRDYSEIEDVLKWFKLKQIRLLTNNPKKISALEKMNIEIRREPLITKLHKYNKSQIEFRIKKLGHLIPLSNKRI